MGPDEPEDAEVAEPDEADPIVALWLEDDRIIDEWEDLVWDLADPLSLDAKWARSGLRAAQRRCAPAARLAAWSRAYVRAGVASVEATTWLYKKLVLAALRTREGSYRIPTPLPEFSAAELAMLREEEYRIDGKGHAVTSSARTPFVDNIKFDLSRFGGHPRRGDNAPRSVRDEEEAKELYAGVQGGSRAARA